VRLRCALLAVDALLRSEGRKGQESSLPLCPLEVGSLLKLSWRFPYSSLYGPGLALPSRAAPCPAEPSRALPDQDCTQAIG